MSLRGHKPQLLLALLLLHRNRLLTADDLIGQLWSTDVPSSARNALQHYISEIRQSLGKVGAEGFVITREPGYVLRVGDASVDDDRFRLLVDEGRRALMEHRPLIASSLLTEALSLWRGVPLENLSSEPALRKPISLLSDRRLTAIEYRVEAELALGHHAELVGDLQELAAAHPLRTRLWESLVLALYRSGRQADALHTVRDAARTVLDEGGVEAGPALKRLEVLILNEDPSLELREERTTETPMQPLPQSPHDLRIRDARDDDFTFVVELMNVALSPYYGGDHRAHAGRIFSTHIAGGTDHIGHFSLEQRMFVADVDGNRAGMIHLVGKRQSTYKISPLVVAPGFRRRYGLGAALLAHAESYAEEHGARTLYCTVAKENAAALQFFQRHGFIAAGDSASHYKEGVTEVMLYKPLRGEVFDAQFDRPHISVLPFEPSHADQVRELLLGALPKYFTGVDDAWVDALFSGYQRRHSGDINLKFKLLFSAVDRNEKVLGIAGATPKKGEPIKVMPFIATSTPAFTALLTDIPFLLRPYGRKLYIHIVPTVEETIALQQRGWSLDAAMPAAYHEGIITQQWSFDLDVDVFMRMMRVKQHFLDEIRSGQKTLEVRVAYDSIKTIQPGEKINLMSRADSQIISVNDVRRYPSFDEMLSVEDPQRIAPGRSLNDLRRLLKEIYPSAKERLGVVVLDVEPITQGEHAGA